MKAARIVLGQKGEAIAAEYLTQRGYRIIERNCRTKLGEIDIVAHDGQTLVFVEVKTRSQGAPVHPIAAVDSRKQRKLRQLAESYLLKHGLSEREVRFDIVCVLEGNKGQDVEHLTNAF